MTDITDERFTYRRDEGQGCAARAAQRGVVLRLRGVGRHGDRTRRLRRTVGPLAARERSCPTAQDITSAGLGVSWAA